MLVTSAMGCSSLAESPPSPIKANQGSSQQIGGSSLLMHSSFGAPPRRHSDDVASTALSTTTTNNNNSTAYRPRRSISSSGGQQQTRHVVCMLNNYSHSLPSNQQPSTSDDDEQDQQARNAQSMPTNLNLTQESFDDDEDDDDEDDEDEVANELNLAVVVGNEDIQSLRGFSTEQGSLDVAFIDEADVDRQKNLVEDPSNSMDIQMSTTDDNETLSQTIVGHGEQQSIEMQDADAKTNELDEILKRNENRGIRLTDSDVRETLTNEHLSLTLTSSSSSPGRRSRQFQSVHDSNNATASPRRATEIHHAQDARSFIVVDIEPDLHELVDLPVQRTLALLLPIPSVGQRIIPFENSRRTQQRGKHAS